MFLVRLAQANPSTSQLARTLEKASNVPNPLADLTKVFLDPPRPGWYASPTLERADRQDEKIEVTLERAFRDTETKRMSDPLGVMVGFLKQREDARKGRGDGAGRADRGGGSWRGRDRYATPTQTPRGKDEDDLERHVASLLPKRRKGDPLPPPSSAHKTSDAWGLPPASRLASSSRPPPPTAHAESSVRVSSERDRARALLAAKKRAVQTDSSSSFGGDTPRTERGTGTLYNRQEVQWAEEARARAAGMGARGGGGGGGDGGSGVGWAERKLERDRRQGGGRWER